MSSLLEPKVYDEETYRTDDQTLKDTPRGVMVWGNGFQIRCHKYHTQGQNRKAALSVMEQI